MIKIMSIFGTRPEAIKMAPIIKEMEHYKNEIESIICVTAQHREMLDSVLDTFHIRPDYDLNIMKKGQTLNSITGTILQGLDPVLNKENPDMILVHGDTTTTFASALAAFYHKIPIGHVEAGLRTHNLYSPYPEEANRQMVSNIAELHFTPTMSSLKNLLQENKDPEKIFVTGNTAIDALKTTVNTQLAEVQHLLNEKMATLNEEICGSSSFQPPHIELKANNYSFETINDQGTGTSFKGLILFDQACLELTRLPFFIHDSLMFSNIEIDRKDKIIEMYGKENKQVFISIDTIDLLSDKAQQIIKKHTVLTLERGGKELFGRSWNEQQSN